MMKKNIYNLWRSKRLKISEWNLFSFFLLCFLTSRLSSQSFPVGFSQIVVGNIYYPTSMAFAPDGRIFCTEKAGKVKIVKNGTVLSTPFLQISVDQLNERGLSSVALDPNFSTNNFVYIYYTTASSPIRNRLSRFTANGDVAVPGSEVVILDFEPVLNSIHNSGGMVFGQDGTLYLAVGNDNVNSYSQDLNTYKGKILRINPDGSVPPGNPFSGSEPAKRIWAYGFRNPWSLAIQPGTGKLFANDVGEANWEEINDITTGGKNFGWPMAEGISTNTAYTNPVYTYPHGPSGSNAGCAITGGAFFNPSSTNYPSQYSGKYFFIDYCNKWINYLDVSGTVQKFDFASSVGGANNYIKVGPDGNLYYFSISQNILYKIIYSNNNPPAITSHPSNKTVSQGQQATFQVSATGASPLSYQWQKNGVTIAGANAVTYTINNVQLSDTGLYRVIVSNSYGTATSNSASLTVTAFNAQPAASILSPSVGTLYRDGDIISFSGNGTDPEDGTLPASAFNWTIEFHHGAHIHPGPNISPGVKSGTFSTIFGEPSANVFFRVILVVNDSKGLTDTTYTDIYPVTSNLSLASQPSGLQLTLEGQPHTTPYSVSAVSGMSRSLGVITPQILNTSNYVFDHWLHGGNASQNIIITDGDTTYTAVFNFTGTVSCNASGSILREYWGNVTGYAVSSIPVNSVPTSTSLVTIFESPSNVADNYGERIRGYVCPPVSGNYTFWIASDDNSELWLSSNDQSANKVKIAYVTGYTSSRQWTKYSSQQSVPINLTAGVRYYIEAIHKEGSQGDNLSVGWQLPNGTFERPVPGSRLSPYSASVSATPVVTITSPANNTTFSSPANITIIANATSNVGSITKVEFFQGNTKLGEDFTYPYSFTWMNVVTGNYVLTAVATDNLNQTVTSPGVNISVNNCSVSGSILREYWGNVTGYAVSSIPVNSVPTSTSLVTIFESPSNVADNYGERIRGYVCPPVSGNYTFWIASDDNSELWLSSNDQSANKVKIAYVTGYTSSRQWTKYSSQQSVPINLTAGVRYYIEAIHKEGSQGDNLSVGWQLPNGTFERPVPGSRLSPYSASVSATPVVTITSPANNTTFSSPANITIIANATSNVGTITKVEFFQGNTKLGEDFTYPYSFTWMNVVTGNYVLTAVATDNLNQTVTSPGVNISVASCATPTITALGPTLFCSGSVVLQANTGPGFIYQWKKDGVNITGATNSSYTASVTGDYQVKVIQGSCIAWSAPMTVKVQNALAAKITPGGSTTICQGSQVILYGNICAGYVYQWIKDGINIPNANTSTYTATTAGNYQLRVTQNSQNAWSALISVQVVTCNAIGGKIAETNKNHIADSLSAFEMKVYPNPNDGLFTIIINMPPVNDAKVNIKIINVLGQEIYSKELISMETNIYESVGLDKSLPTGMYTLEVMIGNKVETVKMLLLR